MKRESKTNWFVLCIMACKELKIIEHLCLLGIESYTSTASLIKMSK